MPVSKNEQTFHFYFYNSPKFYEAIVGTKVLPSIKSKLFSTVNAKMKNKYFKGRKSLS